MKLIEKHPLIFGLIMAVVGGLVGAAMVRARLEGRVTELRKQIKGAAAKLGLSEPDVDAALAALGGEG